MGLMCPHGTRPVPRHSATPGYRVVRPLHHELPHVLAPEHIAGHDVRVDVGEGRRCSVKHQWPRGGHPQGSLKGPFPQPPSPLVVGKRSRRGGRDEIRVHVFKGVM